MSVTEIVAPNAVRDTATTIRPPTDPRKPPKELAGPRKPLPARAPEPDDVRDSQEISTDTILAELARKAEEARAAKAEAEELRRALDAAKRPPPAIGSLTPPPDRKAWQKSLYAFLGALTLFLGGAGTYLGARAATKEQKVDTVIADNSAQKAVVNPLPEQVAELERKQALWKEWARKHADFDRQVFGKLGVKIHEPANALPVDPIKTTARVRKANSVSSAPILEVDTEPPPLP